MTRLEKRYRSALRLLPASHRQVWEEDMVAAFLESMVTGDPDTDEYVADYGRPSWSEIASIAELAIRLRLDGTNAQPDETNPPPDETNPPPDETNPPPRNVPWGQAVRLAVLVAMLTNAAWATAGTALTLWHTGNVTWLPPVPAGWTPTQPMGVWHTAWDLIGNAWLPAYIALVLGHRRVAQAIGLLAIAPAAVFTATTAPLSVSAWTPRLFDVLVVLTMAAFHCDAPPVPRRPWLLALPIGVLVVPFPLFAVQATVEASRVLDWPGLACALLAAVLVGYLTGPAVSRLRHTLPWSLALTLLALATLGHRVGTLPDYIQSAPPAQRATLITLSLAQTIAVIATTAPLAILATRTLRRLPTAPAPAPSTPTP